MMGYSEKLEWEHSDIADYGFLGGSLAKEVLNVDGDWRKYYPVMEVQKKSFDTYSCVSFANNNAQEMMHKCRYGEELNFSDRFLSVVSHTKPGVGNSHKNVAEAKRKNGVVLEEECPFPFGMSQMAFFMYPDKKLLDLGLKWVVDNEYGYERVRREEFKVALKLSPIQVAVDSRTNRTNRFSRPDHSIVLTHIDKKGIPHVFDSYANRFKTYDANYPFSYGTRFHYKQVLKLKIKDMELKLLRNQDNGDIFLVDSDGRLHHLAAPAGFKEFIGNNAWIKEDWLNQPKEVIERYEVGEPISLKKNLLADSLRELFERLKGNK